MALLGRDCNRCTHSSAGKGLIYQRNDSEQLLSRLVHRRGYLSITAPLRTESLFLDRTESLFLDRTAKFTDQATLGQLGGAESRNEDTHTY